jgi:hypothetical protein
MLQLKSGPSLLMKGFFFLISKFAHERFSKHNPQIKPHATWAEGGCLQPL